MANLPNQLDLLKSKVIIKTEGYIIMLVYEGYCPIHGEVFFDGLVCKECQKERYQKEERRWKSLSLEQRIEELREKIDRLENNTLG